MLSDIVFHGGSESVVKNKIRLQPVKGPNRGKKGLNWLYGVNKH